MNNHLRRPFVRITGGNEPMPNFDWFIPVDKWLPQDPNDQLIKPCKGAIWMPVTDIFNVTDPEKEDLNVFVLSPKRCYNGVIMREHIYRYLNYFEKYYDTDHELLVMMAKIKCNIDQLPSYTKEQFRYDIDRLILCDSICMKALYMSNDNYALSLDSKNYRNDKNPSLIYTDRHAKIMLWMSLLQNMVIPLATHFIYVKKIDDVDGFLLWIFDSILSMTDVDIYNKLFETGSSNVDRSAKRNEILWGMQDIRGKDPVTHSIESVNNTILNIMPKYDYENNIISFNYASINTNIHYQVTGIEYEYSYISLSSSIRDSDNNSAMDKYESYTTKTNEGAYLLNKVNCEDTMRRIELMFGPISDQELAFYYDNLKQENGNVINDFQRSLVYNLFYKYFRDTASINNINMLEYVKLVIAASRLLKANNLIIMPYIVSSKIVKLQRKKSINKKEQLRLEDSPNFMKIREMYHSEKIEQYILELMATIVASKFRLIDFEDPEVNGTIGEFTPDMLNDEISLYVNLIL